MSTFGKTLIVGGLALAVFAGYKGCSDFNNGIRADKQIITPIKLAGATITAGANQSSQSMESLLTEAMINSKKHAGENTAIYYKTDIYSVDNLTELLSTAAQHAKELGMLDNAYKTGQLSSDAPQWVRLTYENCVPPQETNMNLRRLLSSEFSGVIGTVYESFNDAVSGGVIVSGEKVETQNMSLINILDDAAGKSWWPTSHANYTAMNNATAHTYFSLIYANMGELDKVNVELNKALTILEKYPDNADLAVIIPGYKNLNMGYLKNTVKDAIKEFDGLNNVDSDKKYTRGWWGQVQKKAESLGSNDMFIGAIAQDQKGRYDSKSTIWWIAAIVGGAALGVTGGIKWYD